ncbi:MAG: DUF1934 domain-containing protein [Oscillospiraceae bacterium]|nr:DUF1934 domain-containing protein [Oscillospiraceae bacterium]
MPKKKVPVVIEIRDSHEVEGETHASEFLCDGVLTELGDGWKLDYVETDGPEQSESALRVQNRTVSLSRRGAYPLEITLEQGVRHNCYYNTPAGMMHLGVYARSVDASINRAGGRIKLAYTLDFCADLMSSNQMEIKVQARG